MNTFFFFIGFKFPFQSHKRKIPFQCDDWCVLLLVCRNMCIIGFSSGTLSEISLIKYIYLDFSWLKSCKCFSYGWYFTFIQGFVYLILIRLQGFTMKQMVNPWKTYAKLSAVLMGSHGLTKGSLAYLNYPAQIMFKSTKVTSEGICVKVVCFHHFFS